MTPLERARSVLGVRFRLHGRAPEEGFDCVGLAAFAYAVKAPRGYPLRSADRVQIEAVAAAAGLVGVDDARAGDLLLLRAGQGQIHLAIDSGNGVIHADAILRRVVERPGAPPWPEIARWRRERRREG